MDETLQTPQETGKADAVKQEALAYRQEATESANRARQNLGAAATEHFDKHGNRLLPRDLKELREKGPQVYH